ANALSLSSESASRPNTSRAVIFLPAAWGGVCGSANENISNTIDAAAANCSGTAVASSLRMPTMSPATIQPMVPKTRTSGNSRVGSLMWSNEIELVSASVGMYQSTTPPTMCSSARMRSVAKNRSATMPTKNGEIIAAMAVAPYASPTCVPSNLSDVPRYVPMVTNHAPQTKYSRNIIVESLARTAVMSGLQRMDGAREDTARTGRIKVRRLYRMLGLERMAFYPTSGGQPHDTGMLGGAAVRDVIDEGERIAHVLDAPVNEDSVMGRVDWPRRFDHMQQHTGQHLLSAVIADLFGWATGSVHFGADVSTLDVDVSTVTPDHVARAERRANEIVFENRPVAVSYERATEAAGLRKASSRDGTLRIVSIADLDRSACGGTHVRATGEIGPILIGKVDKVRQSARLEFLCGMRAVGRARADHDALARLAQSLSAAPNEVADLVARQSVRLKDADSRLRTLETELAARMARERYEAVQADDAGVRRVVERRATGSL